jgi:hypothetical protein
VRYIYSPQQKAEHRTQMRGLFEHYYMAPQDESETIPEAKPAPPLNAIQRAILKRSQANVEANQ